MDQRESKLIYDWNRAAGPEIRPACARIELVDETLRDGLQSPSVRSPSIAEKAHMLHLMAGLGVDSVNLGLPGAGPLVVKDVLRLAREIVDSKLPLEAGAAARTLKRDILPIVEIAQTVGTPIEVCCFLGSSPIRQFTENWSLDRLLTLTHDAISFASRHGLPAMYVTEDTTRAKPEDLRRLYTAAVEAGARRVCVADTVGHATPQGAGNVIRFVREVVDATGEEVAVDWHGHKDRGLSVINSLAAAEAGADRLHGTSLGIGERVGNTPLDVLLVNLHLLGWSDRNLAGLPEYCRFVAECTGVPLPDNHPVVGRDAFRTATGVHAAAVIKAREIGDEWLADRIYSGVPASLVGRSQEIEVGPMSGRSNVLYWLKERGMEPVPGLVDSIFRRAKSSAHVLADSEILDLCREHGVVF